MNRRKPYFTDPEGYPPVTASVRLRVCFSDIDPLGIVWHGNYPKFFEKAYAELGNKTGTTPADFKAAGVGAPVAQMHIDYFLPLFLEDIITVTAALHASEGARLNYTMEIRNGKGELACSGYLIQLFIDLKTREVLWFSPDFWENCKRRWRNGDFHHDA